VEVTITIAGRLIQYNLVPLFIYYLLYWVHRRNFMPRDAAYDVERLSQRDVENEMSSISRGNSVVKLTQVKDFQLHQRLTKATLHLSMDERTTK